MEWLDPLQLGFGMMLFLSVAAFFAGLIDSVAGGGGLISLPATLVAGVPAHFALGTGKFMASVGTVAAFVNYAREGAVVWRIAAVGSAFSFVGSALGSKVALGMDTEALGKIILFLLPVAAVITLFPVRRKILVDTPPGRGALYAATPVLCGAIGFYDGFFGPGTGSFLILGLHLVLGMGLIKASATAKAFNLASNVSSLVVFLLNGKVYFFVAVPMALANIAGNLAGSRMALRGGPAVVRRMLLVSLGLLFATLIWRYYVK